LNKAKFKVNYYIYNLSKKATTFNVSKATSTRYLSELEADWVDKVGTTGVGTVYIFKGLNMGSKKE
jgi:hypothetical protein